MSAGAPIVTRMRFASRPGRAERPHEHPLLGERARTSLAGRSVFTQRKFASLGDGSNPGIFAISARDAPPLGDDARDLLFDRAPRLAQHRRGRRLARRAHVERLPPFVELAHELRVAFEPPDAQGREPDFFESVRRTATFSNFARHVRSDAPA